MIYFRKLRYRNFLSSGDKFTEIVLDKCPTTLIVGPNGSGKSTMLDALSFALFGKAHRNINKPQLVNSVNRKKCEVEVEFDIGSDSYRVFRGISPSKFEIWKNGQMLDQMANSRDYQKMLESNILKLSHKTFHQVVVLGSSSFVPFMQLSTQNRRVIVEDLLDISVFSKMNQLLKLDSSRIKSDITDAQHSLDIIKTKMESEEKNINNLKRINEDHRFEKEQLLQEAKSEVKKIQRKIKKKEKLVAHENQLIDKKNYFLERYEKYVANLSQLGVEIKKNVDDSKLYINHSICPTCDQRIEEKFRQDKIKECQSIARKQNRKLKRLEALKKRANEIVKEIEKELGDISKINDEITEQKYLVKQNQRDIERLTKEISDLGKSSETDEAEETLKSLYDEKKILTEKVHDLREEHNYVLLMLELLRDDGIKTKVIRRYIPLINRLVNKYLETMEFYVGFSLNENFEEEIKSRYRDVFSYENFSEGEKQRINLSLLFTWREVARMKNSIATNLLILDETFDSSLDSEGISSLTKILSSFEEMTSVFVITHKSESLDGHFDRKLEFGKHKNFSVLKEQSK